MEAANARWNDSTPGRLYICLINYRIINGCFLRHFLPIKVNYFPNTFNSRIALEVRNLTFYLVIKNTLIKT